MAEKATVPADRLRKAVDALEKLRQTLDRSYTGEATIRLCLKDGGVTYAEVTYKRVV